MAELGFFRQAATDPERIALLEDEKAFKALVESKKKGAAGEKERAEGRAEQQAIRELVRSLPGTLFKDRDKFTRGVMQSKVVRFGKPIKAAMPNPKIR